ncbi:hypothetical protein [Novacetimonas pomaceti]|uniref:Uncharacterized protein n=1 Tax=Novacetimonas pomaceti TaxID=2021998 RepID=A0A318Q604_9PROT|nr:hypothetical protein [Novacetimonas pomaceti]MBV1835103.1 hypothetical protein [Novacetimonas pomaceti]PYD49290.1 hypothetical protein C3920_00145 [Novacetimonas pomaceti]PYD74997.1 hypothetical protein CFR71_11455 [Novacetimonas pomaceti]
MRSPSLRLVPPMVLTVSAGFLLAAMAQTRAAPPPPAMPATSTTAAAIEGAPGARLAGYLNFCIGNHLLPHEDATPVLDHLIAQTNAVSKDHTGNMDYVYGTVGLLHPESRNSPRLTDLDIPQRRELCQQIRKKAASAT